MWAKSCALQMVGATIVGPVREMELRSLFTCLLFLALAQGSLLPFMEFAVPVVDGEARKTKSYSGLMITAG